METYLLIGVFVGIIQVVDGAFLLRSYGKIDIYSGTSSFIEFCWFFTTIYYLLEYDFTLLGLIIAVGYLSYNISGWIMAAKMIANIESIESLESLTVPKSFVKLGIVYCSACYFALTTNLP
jgi:hypothetical protein